MTKTTEEKRKDKQDAGVELLVGRVREKYAEIARHGTSSCCQPAVTQIEPAQADSSQKLGYGEEELQSVPQGADLGLGCGAPVPLLELKKGEVVLDLGSGGGLDIFLASPLVGSEGRAIGVDMTEEMVSKARENARRGGFGNVEFRLGRLEDLPVEDSSVDAVTSNCVINLVPDKPRVFREISRVLRRGGRLVISDILLDGELPPVIAQDLMAYVGCISGALLRQEYFDALREAGLSQIEILKDNDFVACMGDLPPDIQDLLDRTGVSRGQIEGIVRSVTYRARLQ